jgi:hypothetical protein
MGCRVEWGASARWPRPRQGHRPIRVGSRRAVAAGALSSQAAPTSGARWRPPRRCTPFIHSCRLGRELGRAGAGAASPNAGRPAGGGFHPLLVLPTAQPPVEGASPPARSTTQPTNQPTTHLQPAAVSITSFNEWGEGTQVGGGGVAVGGGGGRRDGGRAWGTQVGQVGQGGRGGWRRGRGERRREGLGHTGRRRRQAPQRERRGGGEGEGS